jgi:ubiquinone/menaquinone biosynthesis C-methylase UbiE
MKADFDIAAKNYDNSFTSSEIGKLQRNLVYYNLEKQLQNTKTIFEINCGTGEDAIWLANKNFDVLATDISSQMIAVAKTKSKKDNLKFEVADINSISEQYKNEKFDLLFSNFGGLNCLSNSEIRFFFENSSKIISEKGKLILVIMPKSTLWEQFYFLLKLDFKNAFRRKKEMAIANVDGENVATYYFNPKDVVNLSKSNFEFISAKPVGFFVPPSYLEPFFKNKKGILNFLKALENKIKNWTFLSKYADHYIIILQKR